MKKAQFKIGKKFYTATGEWLCVDVGQRVVIAYNLDKSKSPKSGWDLQDLVIFDHYDFPACLLKPNKKELRKN